MEAREVAATETKAVDTKPSDEKPSDAKTADGKTADGKTAETRPSAGLTRIPELLREPPTAVRVDPPVPEGPPAQARLNSSLDGASAQAAPPISAKPPVQPGASEPVANSIRVTVSTRDKDTTQLALSLPASTPLAVFERAGVVWIAAELPLPFETPRFEAPEVLGPAIIRRSGELSILQVAMPRPSLVRAAVANGSWVVTLGDSVTGSTDAIVLARGADARGAAMIRAELAEPGVVHWVDDADTGDKVAIVPLKAGPRGILRTQSFVDFKVLGSAHGLVVNPLADDVVVVSGIDDVTISRPRGLALSSARDSTSTKKQTAGPLVIQRDIWSDDRKGQVRERMRDLTTRAAEANKTGRTDARLRLARFQLANGLGEETTGLLDVIAADDQERGGSREVRILTAIANIFANRPAIAAPYVKTNPSVNDPEMELWRAYIDARQRRWPAAMNWIPAVGRHSRRLPRPSQGDHRPCLRRGGDRERRPGRSRRAMSSWKSVDSEYLPKDLLAFLRARLDEKQGQTDEAAEAYEELSQSSDRIIEARAIAAGAALAMAKPDYDREPRSWPAWKSSRHRGAATAPRSRR